MKHPHSDELLICRRCGARIALGKYSPLSVAGSPNCTAELEEATKAEAEKLLSEWVSVRPALSKETGE